MRELIVPKTSPFAPDGAYFDTARVRSYEVGRDGLLTPGMALRYLEFLATNASTYLGFDHTWYERNGTAWFVREMSILLGALPEIDDEIGMATWVSEVKRVQAMRDYALWDLRSGRLVARASARWAYVDTERGLPRRISDEIMERMPILGHSMRARRALTQEPEMDGRLHTMRLTARAYEEDVQQHINNCVYVDWLSEALHRGLANSETPSAQKPAPRPRYLHIEYVRPTLPGDSIRIETATLRRGSRGLAVWQEVYNGADGAHTLHAYSEYL